MAATLGNLVRLWSTRSQVDLSSTVEVADVNSSLRVTHVVSGFRPVRSGHLISPPVKHPRGLLVLPPRSQRYLLGALAETEKTGLVLGVSNYIGAGHRGLLDVMQKICGPVRKIFWGGELLLTNSSDVESFGTLAAINETSGYLHDSCSGLTLSHLENRNANLIAVLSQMQPFLSPQSDFVSYDFDLRNQHLHNSLNSMELSGVNWRHGLGNVLQGAKQPLFLLKCHIEHRDTGLDIDDVIESRSKDIQIAIAFCKILLDMNVFDLEQLQTLITVFGMMLDQKSLIHETMIFEAATQFKVLESYFRERIVNNQGNEFEVIRAGTC